jgi:uncharacterized protein with HEPN domain
MRREVGDYIQDVIDAMEKGMKFIEDMEFEEFVKDDKTVFAVIRALEVIGEAIKNIPEEIRGKYPEIPWRDMGGMRDKLIHSYFGVNLKMIWKTIKEEIPPLKPLFERMLREIERG